MDKIKEELTTSDLVARFGVSRMTISNWATAGLFPGAYKTGDRLRSPWRFPVAGVNAFEADLVRVNVEKEGRLVNLPPPYSEGLRDVMDHFKISRSTAAYYVQDHGVAPGAVQLPGVGRWRLPEGWRNGARARSLDNSLYVYITGKGTGASG